MKTITHKNKIIKRERSIHSVRIKIMQQEQKIIYDKIN